MLTVHRCADHVVAVMGTKDVMGTMTAVAAGPVMVEDVCLADINQTGVREGVT